MTPVIAALALIVQTAADPAAPPNLGALMTLRAGDAACDLFGPSPRALLEASIERARDNQIRAGADPLDLDRATARVDSAPAPACDDPELAALAAGHEARIESLAGYSDLTFPGVHRDWRVDRGAVRAGRGAEPRWRVAQRDGAGQASFGVFQQNGEMRLALAYNSDSPAARAGLMFRDGARQPYPMDFTAGGLLPAPDSDPAASWGAGIRSQSRVSAAARLTPDVAAYLAPAGGETARGFVFAQTALQRLVNLTPRESIAVELFDATGQTVERIWFEVGALRAALAMQAVPLSAPEPVSADLTAMP